MVFFGVDVADNLTCFYLLKICCCLRFRLWLRNWTWASRQKTAEQKEENVFHFLPFFGFEDGTVVAQTPHVPPLLQCLQRLQSLQDLQLAEPVHLPPLYTGKTANAKSKKAITYVIMLLASPFGLRTCLCIWCNACSSNSSISRMYLPLVLPFSGQAAN